MVKYNNILFVLVLMCSSLVAETQNVSELNDFKTAYLSAQEGNYNKAYPYFKKMLDIYPKDPTYNYYVGRCLVYIHNDLNKAIKHLRFASTQNVPSDVYYYLGISYLKTYQFEDAIANYRWFEKSASKKQIKESKVKNYISMAQNGLYLIKYFKNELIYSKEFAPQNSFYKSYQFANMEGQFVDKNLYFNQRNDSSSEQSVLFVPDYIEKNEVLYFSAKNKKRGDYDIYRTKRINDTVWGNPENLGDKINTSFDENYPFIHSDGTTLYFASKGHYSMGGYDLYKSSWSWENNEWTEPENMDFPINSPFDDILFVPSSDKKVAYFTSGREMSESDYMVYKIKLVNTEPYIEYQTNKQIKEYALLNVNITKEEHNVRNIKDEKIKLQESNSMVKVVGNEKFLKKAEYDSLLNTAINLQLKADSIKWLIDDKRLTFDKTENGQDRAVLGNKIVDLERKIYFLQKNADNCYEQVRQIEQINLASKNISYETPEKDKIKNETDKQVIAKETSKLYVEPHDNNFTKSILEFTSDEKNIPLSTEGFGLQIKLPSIYNSDNPIQINKKLPVGIVYMIQLGAYSSLKNPSVFKGLEPLTYIKKENSNILKYFAGKFLKLNNAEKALSIVKSKGFKDSYIVAFSDGKIIPINLAIKLESKSLDMHKVVVENSDDTIAAKNLSIIYVIKGFVTKENINLIDSIKVKLSTEQDIYIEDRESIIYFVIKSFGAFEDVFSAKKEIELVIKKEVEIHAYFAENQIPLEQAKKITK